MSTNTLVDIDDNNLEAAKLARGTSAETAISTSSTRSHSNRSNARYVMGYDAAKVVISALPAVSADVEILWIFADTQRTDGRITSSGEPDP